MSIKVLSDSDTGDATHAGGADWNKHARYFNGTASAINISGINTNTPFLDSRLQLKTGSFVSSVSTSELTGNSTMRWPQPSGTTIDRLLSETNNATIINKALAAWDNNIAGVMKFPSVRKWGGISGGPVAGGGAGEGLLYGFIDMPAIPGRGADPTFGSYWRYNSTTTIDTPTGIKMPQNIRWCLKEHLPYLRCKFRLSSTTNTRFYFGLSSQSSIPAATNTPTANSESCILVGWRSTDTNVTIFSNSGTTSSSSTPSTTTASPTITKSSMANQVRQMEILFTTANSCTVKIMDGNNTQVLSTNTITTNLPADMMAPSLVMANTNTSNVDMDFFFMEMDQIR